MVGKGSDGRRNHTVRNRLKEMRKMTTGSGKKRNRAWGVVSIALAAAVLLAVLALTASAVIAAEPSNAPLLEYCVWLSLERPFRKYARL